MFLQLLSQIFNKWQFMHGVSFFIETFMKFSIKAFVGYGSTITLSFETIVSASSKKPYFVKISNLSKFFSFFCHL